MNAAPTQTELYHHFGKGGVPLYVGISLSALARLVQHRSNAHWFQQIESMTIEKFPTRAAAEAAEKTAIEREKPLFNIQHSLEQKQARKEAREAARIERAKRVKIPKPEAALLSFREEIADHNAGVFYDKWVIEAAYHNAGVRQSDKAAIEAAFWKWRQKRRIETGSALR